MRVVNSSHHRQSTYTTRLWSSNNPRRHRPATLTDRHHPALTPATHLNNPATLTRNNSLCIDEKFLKNGLQHLVPSVLLLLHPLLLLRLLRRPPATHRGTSPPCRHVATTRTVTYESTTTTI